MTDCICENCYTMEQVGKGLKEEWDCACEMSPVYDAEECSACRHKDYCDVPQNPENYPSQEAVEKRQKEVLEYARQQVLQAHFSSFMYSPGMTVAFCEEVAKTLALEDDLERMRKALAERTVWVAERGEACEPEYLTMEQEVFTWTKDIHSALQCSRREDVERLSACCFEDVQRICEHGIG